MLPASRHVWQGCHWRQRLDQGTSSFTRPDTLALMQQESTLEQEIQDPGPGGFRSQAIGFPQDLLE